MQTGVHYGFHEHSCHLYSFFIAKAGKYNGYLLEGMACPGGCIAGAGTIQPIKKTAASLEKMKKEAAFEECMDTKYEARLSDLEQL